MNKIQNSVYKLLITILVSSILVSGCGRTDPDRAPAVEKATDKPIPTKTFAMSVLVSTVPFWNDTKSSWEAIGDGEQIKTTFGGPIDTDGQKQIAEIEALIAKGVDGIAVYPTDSSALIPTINKAVAAGIPVVTYLNDAPGSKRTAYVAAELEGASIKVGTLALSETDSVGKAIIMFAEPGNVEQEARKRGFEQLAEMSSNLEIVGVVSDQFDETKGASQLGPLLSKFPDIKYIFGCNSRSAIGAVSALRERGFKAGDVTITAWDYDRDVLDLIDQGWVKASVAQNSNFMTLVVFNVLEAQSGGWLYPKNRQFKEHNVRPLPDRIIVPVELITKNNLRGYYEK